MFLCSVCFLNEVFFEIHDVLVGSFFCSVDVDVTEIGVLGCFDEVQSRWK